LVKFERFSGAPTTENTELHRENTDLHDTRFQLHCVPLQPGG
jgi:hypothetical protein